jgi:hypothetical protein
MGKDVFTRDIYRGYVESIGVDKKPHGVTAKAEKQAIETGKLQTLVDPSSFNTIRLSLLRVEKRDDGKFEATVGCSMPVETRVDTTGSMGGNVDIALKVLPDVYECCSSVLPDYDVHIATGIFGDVSDRFPLCRPQFEMQVQKIVDQLTMMVPQRAGGDHPEDPDIGIFGGAYLCRHYINRIGLKGYDFTITDAPGRGQVDSKQLKRVFGDDVFEKVAKNGHGDKVYKVAMNSNGKKVEQDQDKKELKNNGVFQLSDVFDDLLKRAHAFVFLIGKDRDAKDFWIENVGKKHVVHVPDMEHVPHVQAVVIGLTEGTLTLDDVPEFLAKFNISKEFITKISEAVVNVPLKAQAKLKNFKKKPVKGDLFEAKPDVWTDENIWPIENVEEVNSESESEEEDNWV